MLPKLPRLRSLAVPGVTIMQINTTSPQPVDVSLAYNCELIAKHVYEAVEVAPASDVVFMARTPDLLCDAFASFRSEGNILRLTGLYVSGHQRRRGIASSMIRRAQSLPGYEYITCEDDFSTFTHPTYCLYREIMIRTLVTNGFTNHLPSGSVIWIKPIFFYASRVRAIIRKRQTMETWVTAAGKTLQHHRLMPVAGDPRASQFHDDFLTKLAAREICPN